MHLTLEFGGGLELLLENSTKVHKVEVHPTDGDAKVTMKGLLSWVKSNLIKERPEMFVKGNSVLPQIEHAFMIREAEKNIPDQNEENVDHMSIQKNDA